MRKSIFLLLTAVNLLFSTAIYAANEKNEKPFVIPELREWQGSQGCFTLTPATKIVYKKGDAQMEKVALQLAADIKAMFGKEIEVVAGKAQKGDIYIAKKADKKLGNEGYQITADSKITLTAPDRKSVV